VTIFFNSVIGKTGKVYAALLGQLAVQGADVRVLGHSKMCAADILLRSFCRLICKDLLPVFRLRSNFISPEGGGGTLLLDVIVDAHQNIM
jgi:hypothetical protein